MTTNKNAFILVMIQFTENQIACDVLTEIKHHGKIKFSNKSEQETLLFFIVK